MNNYQIYNLEIQIALAKNIYLSPMIFEGGNDRSLSISGEIFECCQLETPDHFFLETNISFVDWTEEPANSQ